MLEIQNQIEYQKKTKKPKAVKILVGIIVVISLFMAYYFIGSPQLNKFAQEKQIEGANIVWVDMINQLQTNGYYTVQIGNETLILVPYTPQQEGVKNE